MSNAQPMDPEKRYANYAAQNGAAKLTPAQKRRLVKKVAQQARAKYVTGAQ